MTDQRMSHEEYVLSVRREAVEIASGIVSGDVPMLEGRHALAGLRWLVELDDRDPDFFTFAIISSEIDQLPVGSVRQHWAPDALDRLEPEIQSAIAWATPQAIPACKSIIEWFGA